MSQPSQCHLTCLNLRSVTQYTQWHLSRVTAPHTVPHTPQMSHMPLHVHYFEGAWLSRAGAITLIFTVGGECEERELSTTGERTDVPNAMCLQEASWYRTTYEGPSPPFILCHGSNKTIRNWGPPLILGLGPPCSPLSGLVYNPLPRTVLPETPLLLDCLQKHL